MNKEGETSKYWQRTDEFLKRVECWCQDQHIRREDVFVRSHLRVECAGAIKLKRVPHMFDQTSSTAVSSAVKMLLNSAAVAGPLALGVMSRAPLVTLLSVCHC